MSCKKPLKAYVIGKTAKGKDMLKIVSYKCDHLELNSKNEWEPVFSKTIINGKSPVLKNFIEVPCGQCTGCRLDYAKNWANRCMLEMKEYKENYFITLTYDDDNIPLNIKVNSKTGEPIEDDYVYTLRKKDVQNFIKRLRKQTGQKFRYYLCGEYGSNTSRPHYHIIAFGLHLDDLVFYSQHKLDDIQCVYYNSKTLEKAWLTDSKNGKGERVKKGHIVVAKATWETCAYTARYVMKKLNGDLKNFYEENNIEKEFVLMSRKPGIGKNYYLQNYYNIYKYDEIIVGSDKGGRVMRPPKYFDNLFDLDNPEEMKYLKDKRKKVAENTKKIKLQNTTMSYLDLLNVENDILKNKTKQLIRKGV